MDGRDSAYNQGIVIVNMQDVVERMIGYPAVKRSGRWSFWPCPVHKETDPSFGVRDDHAHCFGCQWHGTAKWFLRDVGRMTWEEIDRYLGNDYLPDVVPHKPSVQLDVPHAPSSEWQQFFGDLHLRSVDTLSILHDLHPIRHEIESRGISRQALKHFQIGWNQEWIWLEEFEDWLAGGLVFPAIVDDQLWSLNVRTETGRPKYLRTKSGSESPFGLERVTGQDTLIVCEGEFDVLTAWSAVRDVADIIGRRGTGAPLEWWYKDRLWRYKRIIKVMDGDGAGRHASDKLAERWPSWEDRCPPVKVDDLGKMAKAGFSIRSFLLENRLICL